MEILSIHKNVIGKQGVFSLHPPDYGIRIIMKQAKMPGSCPFKMLVFIHINERWISVFQDDKIESQNQIIINIYKLLVLIYTYE